MVSMRIALRENNLSASFDILKTSNALFAEASGFRSPRSKKYYDNSYLYWDTSKKREYKNFKSKIAYFIYIRINYDGSLYVRQYSREFRRNKTKKADRFKGYLRTFVRHARGSRRHSDIKRVGQEFIDMKWNDPCFVLMFVDEEHWSFFGQSDPHDPIRFIEEDVDGNQFVDNVTFHDAMNLSIPLESRHAPGRLTNRTGLFFINHFNKDRQGTDRPMHGPDHQFSFDINMNVQFTFDGTPANPIAVTIDPTGTNFGPP